MARKNCIICKESKDEWEDFTITTGESPMQLDVCKGCRLKKLGGVISY